MKGFGVHIYMADDEVVFMVLCHFRLLLFSVFLFFSFLFFSFIYFARIGDEGSGF